MKKIIWSIDAFQEGNKIQKQTVALLKRFAEKTGCQVEPVYLLSPDQLNLTVEFTPPWIEQYLPAAEKALIQSLKAVDIPNLLKPKVLVQNVPSVTHAVKTLSAYALSNGTDMIVMGTHGRKGLPRFFVGSFTETMLLHSRVPIVTVGPETREVSSFQHLLFPTDFSEASQSVLQKVIAFAASLGARVTLFHHVQNPVEPILQSGVYLLGGGWVSVSAYLEEEIAAQTKQAEAILAKLDKHGVSVDIQVDSGPGGITQSLLDYVQATQVDMIAMAAQSGPMAAALIGSITRQVVRAAPCPVWVLHSGSK